MKRAILATLLVVCPALPALAANLEFSANGEVEYDDNVFRSERNKEDDVLFRLRPGLRIYEDHGDDLNFSAGYEAPVEFSIHNSSELNDVDHIGSGIFDYHVNNKVDVFGSESYGYLRSTLRQPDVNTQAQALEPGTLEFNDQRDRVKTNDASLGMNYHFSPRTVGRAIASSSFFDSTRQDRARVWSVSGSADALYKLTLKHQVGGGAGYTYQDFGDRQDISGSHTNTYRVFGSWRWTATPTLSLDLSVGPAYLETEQDDASRVRTEPTFPFSLLPSATVSGFFDKNGNDLFNSATPDHSDNVGVIGQGSVLLSSLNTVQGSNCGQINGTPVASLCNGNVIIDSNTDPVAVNEVTSSSIPVTNLNPGGKRDREFTGFVDLVLTQRWSPNLATALRYSRQQGDASGLGGTAIVDAVSLSNTWDFAERWQLAIRGDWARRQSAFDIAQTYDSLTAQTLASPGGSVPLAARTGSAFNSTRNVDIDTDSWGVGGRITHQLFKTTSIYVQARYSEQDSKTNSLGSDSDFENFLATFGVRHVFEPIPLW
jgi:hypothetical protein